MSLTQEQVAAIPMMYATLGNQRAVARELGCDHKAVGYHLNKLSGEEWDRIKEKQLKCIIEGSTEIIMACVSKINDPEKIKDLTTQQTVAVFKTFSDQVRAWGAIDKGKGGPGDELQTLMIEAQLRRFQKAVAEALATGSIAPLEALGNVSAPAEK